MIAHKLRSAQNFYFAEILLYFVYFQLGLIFVAINLKFVQIVGNIVVYNL